MHRVRDITALCMNCDEKIFTVSLMCINILAGWLAGWLAD